MQLLRAAAVVFSKKILKFFFDLKKVKKRASKVAHNQPRPQPRIDFSYYEISGPDICSLICEPTPARTHSISFLVQIFIF